MSWMRRSIFDCRKNKRIDDAGGAHDQLADGTAGTSKRWFVDDLELISLAKIYRGPPNR